MAFYIEHRHQGPGKARNKKASALEIAAEEFLNGLLCHYEPPQDPYELEEEQESDFHEQLVLRRPPSILKTSSSFEQRRHNKHHKSGRKGRMVRFTGITVKQNNKHSSSQRPRFGVPGLKKLACRKDKFEF